MLSAYAFSLFCVRSLPPQRAVLAGKANLCDRRGTSCQWGSWGLSAPSIGGLCSSSFTRLHDCPSCDCQCQLWTVNCELVLSLWVYYAYALCRRLQQLLPQSYFIYQFHALHQCAAASELNWAELWKASLHGSRRERGRERGEIGRGESSGELIIHMNWAMLKFPLLKQLCHAKCLCYLFKFPLCTLTLIHTPTHTLTHIPTQPHTTI